MPALAAASEDAGVAALQSQHRPAAADEPQHRFDDRILRQGVVSAFLSHADPFGAWRDQLERLLGREVVVPHDA